jgi:KDO2-lipid IV(A) lauroyltransferase
LSVKLEERIALAVLGLLGRLPLPILHALGSLAGRLALRIDRRLADTMRANIRQAGLAGDDPAAVDRFARVSARELGKGLLEVLPFWCGRADAMLARVRTDESWDAARQIATAGAVIFLTPHLGCFEAAGQFLARHLPITVMYRPPRLAWLDPLLRAGRAQGLARVTTADARGVRAVLKALKDGHPVGLLPDQVPLAGGGVRAGFFGRDAYTTTLIGKLQRSTGAAIIVVAAERLPRAAGYALTFHPLPTLPADDALAARELNAALEAVIRRCPEQYLWTYNRYKQPAGGAF